MITVCKFVFLSLLIQLFLFDVKLIHNVIAYSLTKLLLKRQEIKIDLEN